MIKIFFTPTHRMGRDHLLIRQGIINNPRTELVDNEKESDFVFQFYSVAKRSHHVHKDYPPKKTVYLDYHDSHSWVWKLDCKAYFKRSWVKMARHGEYVTKRLVPRPDNCHPISFAIMDEFIIDENIERDLALSCTLRRLSRHHNRIKVLELLEHMNIQGNVQIGPVSKGQRWDFNDSEMRKYFRLLKRSRIIITCNPDKWEGDYRTWEAFASGALVFIDRMFTPMTHPLVDGKHCIFYDVSEPGFKLLKEKINHYLDNPLEAEIIAKTGHDFAMKYHRASSRIDEILEIVLMSNRRFVAPFLYVRIADNVLNEIFLIAKQLEITAFLIFGTCLGFVRDKGYIEGDRDLDIGMICKWEEKDVLIDTFKRNGFILKRTKAKRKHFNYYKNKILVDIWFKEPNKFYSDFDNIDYKGRKYLVPHPVEEYLSACYSNWKVKEDQMTRYWD